MNQDLKPTILITEALPLFEEEEKMLRKYGIVKLAKGLTEEDLIAEIGTANLLMVVYAKITKKIIDSAKNLKGIVRYGIGVDNIDLEAATKRRIVVANVPDYCINAVADHVFALVLALNRKILIADHSVRTHAWGTWTSPHPKLEGVDLDNKVFGLIGLGKIGRAVAARAKGFNMKVIAYDPLLNTDIVKKTIGIELVDLDTLLQDSDVVSVHVPLNRDTYRMIRDRELQLMKKTAYIINTARGPIIDETALCKAIRNQWIAGAGIDVYQKEPPDAQNKLFELDNVVLTPHIAYYTEEAIWRLEMSAVKEAVRILKGKLPKNLVNKELLQN